MARSHRNRSEVQARRELVFQLWCKHAPWPEIASKAGVSVRQAQLDLAHNRRRIEKREADSVARSIRCRDRAIGFYSGVIRKALAEFERSKVDKYRRKQKARQKAARGDSPGGTETETEEWTEGRIGQARLLMTAIKARREIDALEQLPKGSRQSVLPAGSANVVFYIPGGRDDPNLALSAN